MGLFFHHAQIDLRQLQRWTAARALMPRHHDEGYALHCLLGENVGPAQLQPFRLLAAGGRFASLYAYSMLDSPALREQIATVSAPDFAALARRWQCKAMPSDFPRGKRLGFDLRVRPTRRGGAGGRAERDAYPGALAAADAPPNRECVYLDWLSERLARRGAALDGGRLVSHRRSPIVRQRGRAARGTEPPTLPDAVIQGTLRVLDSAAFADALQRGVGRHRAYGYGMLLLRPAGSARC